MRVADSSEQSKEPTSLDLEVRISMIVQLAQLKLYLNRDVHDLAPSALPP
jgi:hypothetical protein